jgi:hypothetical protein
VAGMFVVHGGAVVLSGMCGPACLHR